MLEKELSIKHVIKRYFQVAAKMQRENAKFKKLVAEADVVIDESRRLIEKNSNTLPNIK